MIYFIQDTISKNIKIGVSRNPNKRLATLQISHDSKLIILKVIKGSTREEKLLHKMYNKYRIRGEWFFENEDLLKFISNPEEELLISNPEEKSLDNKSKIELSNKADPINEFDIILARIFGKSPAMARW